MIRLKFFRDFWYTEFFRDEEFRSGVILTKFLWEHPIPGKAGAYFDSDLKVITPFI
jgi:hypothetical protein